MDKLTFVISCPRCCNPISITVEKGHYGGIGTHCPKCCRVLSVNCSYSDSGLIVYSVL